MDILSSVQFDPAALLEATGYIGLFLIVFAESGPFFGFFFRFFTAGRQLALRRRAPCFPGDFSIPVPSLSRHHRRHTRRQYRILVRQKGGTASLYERRILLFPSETCRANQSLLRASWGEDHHSGALHSHRAHLRAYPCGSGVNAVSNLPQIQRTRRASLGDAHAIRRLFPGTAFSGDRGLSHARYFGNYRALVPTRHP